MKLTENQEATRNVYQKRTINIGMRRDNLQYVFTPYSLCEEMILKLKENTGLKEKNILVFNLEFAIVLIEQGVSPGNITFLTDCIEKVAFAKFLGVAVMMEDFKKIIDEKRDLGKFDVVIGNPPYQMTKNKVKEGVSGMCGGTLWDKFMYLSINELATKDGYVVLVHPGQWRKPDHTLLELVKQYNLVYLSIHGIADGQKTFSASTGYDWYILQKTNYGGQTTINDVDGKQSNVDISGWQFIPNCEFNKIQSLLSDVENDIVFSHSDYETRKDWMSNNKSEEFQYPCVYGLTQKDGLKLYWSETNKNGHFGISKAIIPLSKYTDVFIDDQGTYGICQFAFGIPISSKEEGEQIKQVLLSKKFKPIWDAFEWIYNGKEWRVFKYLKKNWWKEFIDDIEKEKEK